MAGSWQYALAVAGILCSFLGFSGGSLGPKDSLRFLVIGDWGGLPFFPYRTAIEGAIANELGKFGGDKQIEFVLALGDNFYFDGVKNIEDPRFQETYNRVFTSPYLDVDWYLLAGNHDHNGNVSAQIAYTNLTKRWNFPDYYYTLKFSIPQTSSKIEVIMIDTVLLCGNSDHDFLGKQPEGPEDELRADTQWQWIENAIRSSKAEYLIVAGHYPVWSITEHGPTQCLVDRLLPMLHKYNVTAYMCGHDHNLQHIRYQDSTYKTTIDYFISGAANFIDPSLKHNASVPAQFVKFHWADNYSLGGFAYVNATAKSMDLAFHEVNGRRLHTQTMYPRQ